MRFKKFSCVISFVLVLVLLCSITLPSAKASFLPTVSPYIGTDLFGWLVGQAWDVSQFFIGLFNEDRCPVSESGYHNFEEQRIDGSSSKLYYVCQDCGITGGEVLTKTYGQPAGHGLGGQSGGTTGSFGYVKKVEDELGTTVVGKDCFYLPPERASLGDVSSYGSVVFDPSNVLNSPFVSAVWNNGSAAIYVTHLSQKAPVSGEYSIYYDLSLVNCTVDLEKMHEPFSVVKDEYLVDKNWRSYNNGTASKYFIYFTPIDRSKNSSVYGYFYFKVVPHDYQVDNFTSSIGGASTRMSGLLSEMAGTLFGTMNDAGELVVSAAKSIFSETDNKYTNPATGASANVTDWTYDYSDRSYHLTTEEGDTVTVTYGDENITIQEGDTTYNVYYVIDSSAGSDPCPEGGDHDWQLGETIPATCVTAGSETRTCSKCGEDRTTQLPALGHKWKVKQTTQTKYDEAGELIQQGFTIYECERCGEQYKQTDETGPPGVVPGGSGGSGGGSSGGDGGDEDSIWDSIVDFFKSIAASFASLPDWFSRFSEFLASAFSYLPDEIVLLLTFGVFAVVGIGIWKAVRR